MAWYSVKKSTGTTLPLLLLIRSSIPLRKIWEKEQFTGRRREPLLLKGHRVTVEWLSHFVFGKSRVKIMVQKPYVMDYSLRDFPQSLRTSARIVP
jgi:hypothetical protein